MTKSKPKFSVVVKGFKSKEQARDFKIWLDMQDQDLDEHCDINEIPRMNYKVKIFQENVE